MGWAADQKNEAVNRLHEDLNTMGRRIRELEKQLAEAINGQLPPDQQREPDSMEVRSGVSGKSGEGFVVFRWFTSLAHLTPDQAWGVGRSLIEAAEAAKTESMIMRALREAGGDVSDGAAIVSAIREIRDREAKPE